ncbi:hypothetical protein AVEN_52542-1 [Araneus ventricosus]|uniref:Uncharacterized protein n=1 Tax=Araneus ventricosus TaxID=182803 RepID=A0A4Y2KLC9_ARAVE|nr:hypothetical protein AVEN_52542-1 [Araneus ventricosus]
MIDILMPNDVQFTENFSSEIDNSIDAGVFEEHSSSVMTSEIIQTEETAPKLIPFSNETLFSEETAAPSTSKGNGDNKSGNKDELLVAFLDEMNFSSEMANELPTVVVLETASDAKAIGSELLVSTEILDSKEIEIFEKQTLKNDDERAFGSENITVETAVIAQTAGNEADGEKSSTFFDEKCSLQDAPILEKYDEKTIESAFNHLAAENIAAEGKSITLT